MRNFVLFTVFAILLATNSVHADRWWCTNGHCFLIVETYDANGNVNGYCDLHNGPDWTFGGNEYLCVPRGLDDPPSSTPLVWIPFESTQRQDEDLIDCWGTLDQDPHVHSWNMITSHCYVGPTGLVTFAPQGPPITLKPLPESPLGKRTDDPYNPFGGGRRY